MLDLYEVNPKLTWYIRLDIENSAEVNKHFGQSTMHFGGIINEACDATGIVNSWHLERVLE